MEVDRDAVGHVLDLAFFSDVHRAGHGGGGHRCHPAADGNAPGDRSGRAAVRRNDGTSSLGRAGRLADGRGHPYLQPLDARSTRLISAAGQCARVGGLEHHRQARPYPRSDGDDVLVFLAGRAAGAAGIVDV